MKFNFQDKKFTSNELRLIPHEPGVYSFYDDRDYLLYIGKAIDLNKRVTSYFHKNHENAKTEALVSLISFAKIITVRSEYESLLLEAKLINFYKPKYNVIWKDDKHYIYIKITKEKFPKIQLARKNDDLTSKYYGPFPSVWIIRDILRYVRNIIPYCTQNRKVKKSCFYSHIGLCDPCPGSVSGKQSVEFERVYQKYKSNINKIRSLLEGKYTSVEKILKDEMLKYSRNSDFENAALIRDKLRKLTWLLQEYHPPSKYMHDPYFASKTSHEEGEELLQILNKENLSIQKLDRIECYDISNISGKLATGSMVVFIGCQPMKQHYRRFRIKLKSSPDDFAMLSEVISRRLKHSEWDLPDLFIIDGGKPQLSALQKVFEYQGINLPMIGIAKRFEELVLPGSFKKIRLKGSSGALHLVQRIRDEAHRFAHSYHETLRLKNLLG